MKIKNVLFVGSLIGTFIMSACFTAYGMCVQREIDQNENELLINQVKTKYKI